MKWTGYKRSWGQMLAGAIVVAVPILVMLWVGFADRPVSNDPILLDYINDPVYAQATDTHTPTPSNTPTNTHTPTLTPSLTPSFTPDKPALR